MKKFITILALTAAVITGPAFAKDSADARRHAPEVQQQSSDAVTFDNKGGQDPDGYVRLQILRDAEAGHM